MQHRKLIALLALLLTALLLFTACGEEKKEKKSEEPKELSGQIKVVAQTGTAALSVFKNMGDNYQIKTYKKIGDLRTAIKKGKYDAAVVSAGIAAEMYGRTKKGLYEVSPVTLDGIYIVASGYSVTGFRPSWLVNKRVKIVNKNSTADQVCQKVMQDAGSGFSGVRVKYINSYDAAKRAFAEWNAIVVCSEPYAAKLDKISEVNKVYDLSADYVNFGRTQIPTDVLIVSKKMAEERADDIDVMKNEYETALGAGIKSSAKLVFYNKTDRGIQLMREYNKTMGNAMKYYEN